MKKILLIAFILVSGILAAQDNYEVADKALMKKINLANYLLEQRSYYNATEKFSDLVSEYPENRYFIYKLGYCFFKARDYENSLLWFNNYEFVGEQQKDNKEYPLAYFYQAHSLKMTGKYENAQKKFLKFIKTDFKGEDATRYKDLATNEIQSCAYALELIASDTVAHQYNVAPMDKRINSGYSDFAPHSSAPTKLMFTSIRSDSVLRYEYGIKKIYPSTVYQTVKRKTEWAYPEPIISISDTKMHVGNAILAPNKKELYLTKCAPDKKTNQIICTLCKSQKNGKEWDKPVPVKKVNEKKFTTTQPSLAKTKIGKTKTQILFFVSNRPGGVGGLDIWYSTIDKEGNATDPVNAGNIINTIGDEITPFYDGKNNVLYFSSNYHHGLGGMDVFKAVGNADTWGKPEHMGTIINSSYDDTYYSLKKGSTDAYVVSNRPGVAKLVSATCCDDIFQVKRNPTYQFLATVVSDDQYKTTLEGVQIAFMPTKQFMRNKKNAVRSYDKVNKMYTWSDTTSINNPIDTLLDDEESYILILAKEGYETEVLSLDTLINIADNNGKMINLKLAKVGSKKRKALSKDALANLKDSDVLVLEFVFFDTDKSLIKKDAFESLNLLASHLIKNKKIKIEIGGHTDSHGDDAYNLRLSQRRAEAIVKYLSKIGVSKSRMIAKGYGEKKPVQPNEFSDGSDNPIGRQANRRSEVRIVK